LDLVELRFAGPMGAAAPPISAAGGRPCVAYKPPEFSPSFTQQSDLASRYWPGRNRSIRGESGGFRSMGREGARCWAGHWSDGNNTAESRSFLPLKHRRRPRSQAYEGYGAPRSDDLSTIGSANKRLAARRYGASRQDTPEPLPAR